MKSIPSVYRIKKTFRSFNQQFHRLACTLNPFNKHKLKTTNTSDINVKDHIMSQNNVEKPTENLP